MPDDAPTNTASGSNEDEDENAASPDVDDCHVIVNDKSTEFMLATVVEETGKYVFNERNKIQTILAVQHFQWFDCAVSPSLVLFNS